MRILTQSRLRFDMEQERVEQEDKAVLGGMHIGFIYRVKWRMKVVRFNESYHACLLFRKAHSMEFDHNQIKRRQRI